MQLMENLARETRAELGRMRRLMTRLRGPHGQLAEGPPFPADLMMEETPEKG